KCISHEFNDKEDYYFRFENKSHHAGEYQNYIEEFATKMNLGLTPKPDLSEGIRTLAVMEAMVLSMTTGTAIHVKDVLEQRNTILK
ncbi:MAG: Gfo/Idh/MocA family oxidoreductase, partial [Lachnotalea sp.]